MNRLERNRLHAEAIVEKISRNLELSRAVRITEIIDLRKARLYRLIRELQQLSMAPRVVTRLERRYYEEVKNVYPPLR